jgi:hypothetical protein
MEISELIKPYQEKQEEKIVAKKETYSPFDFIKSVSHTKRHLINEDVYPDVIEDLYNPYIVNRGFSYFIDTILHANEMNQHHHLFKKAQYDYYFHSLKSKNRFSKWFKLEKNEILDIIQERYQCNRVIARQYLKCFNQDEIKNLINKNAKGGPNN